MKRPKMGTRILKIQSYLNNEVTTFFPVQTFNEKEYVPLENAMHLVNAIKTITKLANGDPD